MQERIPNLFVIGAMRSGTTAFHEALGRHPAIFMSSFKEPAFLADPRELARDSRIVAAAGYAGDRSRYLSLFAGAGEVRYAGESSTHYTKLPRITGVAARMAAFSREARILYLVRDPVRRTLSHYRFSVDRKEEQRACFDAVRSEPFYRTVSDYPTQLRPYVEVFGMDRIWVGALEDLVADPQTEFTRLYRWLGLEPDPAACAPLPQRNQITRRLEVARGPRLVHRIRRTAGYRRIAANVAPTLRDAIRRTLQRPVDAAELEDPAASDYLREVHRSQVSALEELTGRTFDRWTATRPG